MQTTFPYTVLSGHTRRFPTLDELDCFGDTVADDCPPPEIPLWELFERQGVE